MDFGKDGQVVAPGESEELQPRSDDGGVRGPVEAFLAALVIEADLDQSALRRLEGEALELDKERSLYFGIAEKDNRALLVHLDGDDRVAGSPRNAQDLVRPVNRARRPPAVRQIPHTQVEHGCLARDLSGGDVPGHGQCQCRSGGDLRIVTCEQRLQRRDGRAIPEERVQRERVHLLLPRPSQEQVVCHRERVVETQKVQRAAGFNPGESRSALKNGLQGFRAVRAPQTFQDKRTIHPLLGVDVQELLRRLLRNGLRFAVADDARGQVPYDLDKAT